MRLYYYKRNSVYLFTAIVCFDSGRYTLNCYTYCVTFGRRTKKNRQKGFVSVTRARYNIYLGIQSIKEGIRDDTIAYYALRSSIFDVLGFIYTGMYDAWLLSFTAFLCYIFAY